MIETELENIYGGEPIEIDEHVEKLVREAVKKLPVDVIEEYESQLNDIQNDPETRKNYR